ncbi:MAG: hypothetical protein CM15mP49_04100 [Actinomycetota bacterium]|nr:MAG: hypothetical protein CM15mP49_04100 [Actinomycetota bacterium]
MGWRHQGHAPGVRTAGLDLVQDANRESIVTDLPGHGANYHTASDMTYEKCYQSVLSSISTPPVDAIGFSLGARILLTVASRSLILFVNSYYLGSETTSSQ